MTRYRCHARGRSRVVGFTLIELMVVVAVIAILSAIAYPSYTEYVLRSKRAQAKAEMVEYMQRAERMHTLNNSYSAFKFSETGSQTINSPRTGTAAYQLTINPGAQTYTITAVPQGGQAKDSCGTLKITNTDGVIAKTASGSGNCW